MGVCNVCGNEYDKTFKIKLGSNSYAVDSFQCAISVVAPACDNCGLKILGHGVEANNKIYCGAHCAEKAGIKGAKDRVS